MEQTLEGTIEETSIASIVKTAADAGFPWPSRVDRTSVERFLVERSSHALARRVCFLERG
jgi:hypothetical protein